MNREKLSVEVAEMISTASKTGEHSHRRAQVLAEKVLVKTVVNMFIDCEISVSTAMDVLDQVKRTITAETVINREANEKEFFS